ncbi:MAG TPA: L,D-transpeptidase family protein [Clostridiales bacterium]|nr:L,D-transpeptidase family protein [Clostridiales bacterium]
MNRRICLFLCLLLILILFASGCSTAETITGSIIEHNEPAEEPAMNEGLNKTEETTEPAKLEQHDTSQTPELSQETGADIILPDPPSDEQQGQAYQESNENQGSTPAPHGTPVPCETKKPDDNMSKSSRDTPENTKKPSKNTPEKTPMPTVRPTASPTKAPKTESSMPYQIEVDVTNQVVTVFGRDSSGNYTKVVRQMICSTGKPSTPTPLGTFKLPGGPYDRGVWGYFAKYKTWARYFTRIKGSYLFHSVLYSKQDVSTLKKSTVEALGTPVSHGCIRLMVEDARWIYENALAGTIVNIVKKPKNPELTKKLKEKIVKGGTEPSEEPAPKPTESPRPAETPAPAESPKPTATPIPSESPKPTETPKPTESAKPTETPIPTQNPKPTETPKPTESPIPTETPAPTASP